MSLARRFLAFGAPLVLAAAAASCTDAGLTESRGDARHPSAAVVGANAQSAGERGVAGNQASCTAPRTVTGTGVIGPKGGTINFGPHQLIIPRGALSKSIEVTATATTGDILRIDLLPGGLQLNAPAELTIKTGSCTDDAAAPAASSRATERPSSATIQSSAPPTDSRRSTTLTVWRFGGYIIAT